MKIFENILQNQFVNDKYARIHGEIMDFQTFSSIKKEKNKELVSKEEYERRIREIVKCKKDINYFAENYYKIVTLDEGLVNIKLYDVQRDLLKFMQKNNRIVTMASRQSGKCVFPPSTIILRSKKNGEINKISVENFFESMKKNKSIKTK